MMRAKLTPLGMAYRLLASLEERMAVAEGEELDYLEPRHMNLGMQINAMEQDQYEARASSTEEKK